MTPPPPRPGCGQFGAQGLDWQNLCRGPLHIATYSIYKLWASRFQRRKFFSHYKSMGANDPRGMASLDPRGLIGSIYVVDHYTLLHTNTYKFWASWFQRRRFFKVFPIISLWELMTHGVWPIWFPGAWLAGFM